MSSEFVTPGLELDVAGIRVKQLTNTYALARDYLARRGDHRRRRADAPRIAGRRHPALVLHDPFDWRRVGRHRRFGPRRLGDGGIPRARREHVAGRTAARPRRLRRPQHAGGQHSLPNAGHRIRRPPRAHRDGAGVLGPPIYFASSGPQRLRVQVREDGLGIDQIVLSSGTYLTNPPGAAKNDTTILPER